MNETIKTPTLAELKAAGYEVDIDHCRLFKIAYEHPTTRKLVIHTVCHPRQFMSCNSEADEEIGLLSELLPKGGKTNVMVRDPVSNLDFTATATCREDENYDKRIGVEKCLDRIVGLMLVCEYQNKDGFKVRVRTE